MKPEFGLYPKDFEPKMCWGARAIIKESRMTEFANRRKPTP